MLKPAPSTAAWVGRTASVVFVLAAVLAGCSGETGGGSGGGEGRVAQSQRRPRHHLRGARGDDRDGRQRLRRVFGDRRVRTGGTNGSIICEAGGKSSKIRSCAYTPTKGFTGTDKFEYKVKDAAGKTDTAMVHVTAKPES